MKTVIAVDGGGSKTEFWLCRGSLEPVARYTGGGANPHSVGVDCAARTLIQGVRALSASAGGPVDACFMGVAGCGTGDAATRLAAALRQALPCLKRVVCASDVQNVLACGLGGRDGCALICGTGSVCFVQRGGQLARLGGWGYLFDGAGGGFDLGRDAVTAALRHLDGRDPPTLLTGLLEKQLGQPVDQAVSRLYEGGAQAVAALAPLVFQAHRLGDGAAGRILRRGAGQLGELLRGAARQLSGPFPAVVAGGVALHQAGVLLPLVREYAPPEAELFVLQDPPVKGAAQLALTLAEEGEHD